MLVFAAVFLVGFVLRHLMTTPCPWCGSRVDKGRLVCASCGREVRA